MGRFKDGQHVRISASVDWPEAGATIVADEGDGMYMVEIDREDRDEDDLDGLSEIHEDRLEASWHDFRRMTALCLLVMAAACGAIVWMHGWVRGGIFCLLGPIAFTALIGWINRLDPRIGLPFFRWDYWRTGRWPR